MFTLWLVVLLAVCANSEEFSEEKLKKLSTEGQNYLNKQIENAISGAKTMKSLADKNDREHQKFLRNLEQADKQKKDALAAAKEAQRKLNKTEKCMLRESMWEECKPCLKQTCTKFYSRICRRGFNTIEKKLDKFFSETPVDSVWVNGEKLDSLVEKNEELDDQFEQVERQFEDMDELYKESTRAFEDMDSFTGSPFDGMGFFPRHFSLFPDYPFRRLGSNSFGHGMFSSLFDLTQKMFENFHRIMHEPELNLEPFPEGEESNWTSPDGKNQFICREIRRKSDGCMKLSDKCEKCKELMSLECFDTDHKPLRRTFEESLSIAENFAKIYDDLMVDFQEYMKNQTRQLENLNKQFGWVSKLANYTKSPDGFYNIKAIISSSLSSNSTSGYPDTEVTVQIFDSPPLTFTVPGNSDWNDPQFSDWLAQKALDLYNKRKMQVSPAPQLETIEA